MARAKSQDTPPVDNDEFDQRTKELQRQQRADVSRNERFSDDQMRDIGSFEDALKLAAEAYGGVQKIDEFELGNGFRLLGDNEKKRLVDVPFIIVHYQFNEGDYGDDFVSVSLVTSNGDKIIMNDGSTGICAQLRDVAQSGRYGGIFVEQGLRESEYDTCLSCGKPRKKRQNPCLNELDNGSVCGNEETERGKGATYYLGV